MKDFELTPKVFRLERRDGPKSASSPRFNADIIPFRQQNQPRADIENNPFTSMPSVSDEFHQAIDDEFMQAHDKVFGTIQRRDASPETISAEQIFELMIGTPTRALAASEGRHLSAEEIAEYARRNGYAVSPRVKGNGPKK